MIAGLEDLAMILPILRVVLEVQASQEAESWDHKLVNAASKVLLEWITGSSPKQGGKSFSPHAGEEECEDGSLMPSRHTDLIVGSSM